MRHLAAARELALPVAYMARKIKFQIWYLFILVPKFYGFYIKPNVFVD